MDWRISPTAIRLTKTTANMPLSTDQVWRLSLSRAYSHTEKHNSRHMRYALCNANMPALWIRPSPPVWTKSEKRTSTTMLYSPILSRISTVDVRFGGDPQCL